MAASIELLISDKESWKTRGLLEAMREASPLPVKTTSRYQGKCDLLMLWGVGRKGHDAARDQHVASGRHAFLWDVGYFGKDEHFRVSIDHQHPQWLLDRSPDDGSRWDAHRIMLRDTHDDSGHILLIGIGPKSHAFLGTHGWEQGKLLELRERFPGRRIVFRPKPGREAPSLDCDKDASATIEDALQGSALVVCRHSNVAVDACVAGVPFECDDGAARWLCGKPYSEANRRDFLRRLAWWQWKTTEASIAWKFLLACV